MTRVLEFVVALIMVFVLAVIVGLFLPSHAHIERSIEISHNPQHIYDVLNNFRRFQDYAGGALQAQDPQVKFSLSGPAYGPGATFNWTGNDAIGSGKLVNRSGNIDLAGNSTVTWDISNDWHGENKTFTFTVAPRHDQRVSTVTWGYDVDYGWNLIDRYSQLWIHGAPGATIQYGLDSLQNMLAGIPNVDYAKLNPGLYQTSATPVLLISTKATRTLDDIDAAKAAALKQIEAAMARLGVKAAGPTTTITNNWGDTTYTFDLAVPIDSTTLAIDGKSYDLTKLPSRPTAEELAAQPAASASAGQPASASSSAQAAESGPAPGSLDKQKQLVVNAEVRAAMLPARQVLEAEWTGEAGIPLVRMALQAYADTHGYPFNETSDRLYDQLASLPSVPDADQIYRVYLPVQNAPEQTPDQIAGRAPPLKAIDPSIWAGEGAAKPTEAKAEVRKKPERARKKRRHR
jgi:hypothetical protein